jgi:hypothetical protein
VGRPYRVAARSHPADIALGSDRRCRGDDKASSWLGAGSRCLLRERGLERLAATLSCAGRHQAEAARSVSWQGSAA